MDSPRKLGRRRARHIRFDRGGGRRRHGHGGLSSIEERALTIPKTGWDIGASEAPEGVYYVDIPLDSVTEALIPIVNVQPKQLATAKKCGLYPVCRTLSGGIRLYAEKAPESEITATVVLMKEPEN